MHNSEKNTEVISFGCRLNIFESEIIKDNLTKSNLNDVVVFNTCTVTKEAERQALQAIRKHKRENPNTKIIVTGCAAQSNPEMFIKMHEVDKVLGNQEKLSPDHYHFNNDQMIVGDIMAIKETANHLVQSFDGKSRAFLQIQNGCDHRCTFCIIPLVRGNNRSVPIGIITEQIKILLASGYHEIVFTGVDITAYGSDLPGTPTLAQMIKRILNLIPALHRLRLSSVDVAEIDDELAELMIYESRLMPHFHLSLQSGDNMILKRMKRRHNAQQLIEFCHKIREKRPSVAYGADIIVGFPTETDEMFANSVKIVEEADIQYLHVFPYSPRPNTPASRITPVPKDIVKNRAKILRAIGQKQVTSFFKKNLSTTAKLLYQNNNMGYTEEFIPVKLISQPLDGLHVNNIINIELIDYTKSHMLARVI